MKITSLLMNTNRNQVWTESTLHYSLFTIHYSLELSIGSIRNIHLLIGILAVAL